MTVSRLLLSALLVPLLAMPSGAQLIAPVALRALDGATPTGDWRAGRLSTGAPLTAASGDIAATTVQPISPGRTIAGGLVGGALGTVGGFALGVIASDDCNGGEDCGQVGGVVGAVIGESVGLALGAHIGARSTQHDKLLLTSLASAGIAAAGALAGVGLSEIGGNLGLIMVPLTPVLQLAAVMAIEGR
jgi:hypothetical protein